MKIDSKALSAAHEAVLSLKKREDGEYSERLSALRAECPELAMLESRLSAVGAETVTAAISGNTAAIEALRERAARLSAQKAELLKKNGLPPSPRRSCEKCDDSGVLNGKYCECVLKQAKRISLETALGPVAAFGADFSNFSLDRYPEEADGNGCSPRKIMSTNLRLCKDFCDSFPAKKNLLFSGSSGLGKTHLSIAIATDLLMKGYSVVYGSAQGILSKAVRDEMDWNGSGNYVNELLACDLLILDDLGTELRTSYTVAMLYNIVNTRLTSGLSTVISTNMNLQQLEKSYDQRIMSRLIGNYTCRTFLGKDIRQQKAAEGFSR